MAYQYTKFDNSGFVHFIDMIGTTKKLNGSRDLTVSLSGSLYDMI